MFTTKTTYLDLKNNEIIGKLASYLIYNQVGDGAGNLVNDDVTLEDIQEKNPTWNAVDMAYGLNCILENGHNHYDIIFNVYSKEEIDENPELEDVKLIYFPPRNCHDEKTQPLILAAGGAYGAVCSLVESFPVAAKFSEAGYSVFCLNYRVAGAKALFPKPMEDLAAAYRFLRENEKRFEIDLNHYAVGGFSAGGHLAACWGTKELGYRRYHATKPELMILVYPLINVWRTLHLMPEPICNMMLMGYLGASASEENCRIYNVDEVCDEDYPATYLIQSQDDSVVPVWNTEKLNERIKNMKIPIMYDQITTGGHGFGLGTNTMAEEWTKNAISFWKTVNRENIKR